jgi:hypothetical protein
MPDLFRRWRVLLAALVPVVSYGFGAFGTGWPVFNALHVVGGSAVLVNLGQVATLALGFAIISVAISRIAIDGPRCGWFGHRRTRSARVLDPVVGGELMTRVGKSSIYLRWADQTALQLDMLTAGIDQPFDTDTGRLRGDLLILTVASLPVRREMSAMSDSD